MTKTAPFPLLVVVVAALMVAAAPAQAAEVLDVPVGNGVTQAQHDLFANPTNSARVINYGEEVLARTGGVANYTPAGSPGLPPQGTWSGQAAADWNAYTNINTSTAPGAQAAKQTSAMSRAMGVIRPLVGRANLVAGTFSIGYLIGTGANKLFLGIGIDQSAALPSNYANQPAADPITKGGTIYANGQIAAAPADGFYFTWILTGSTRVSGEMHAASLGGNCAQPVGPGGWTVVRAPASSGTCNSGAVATTAQGYFQPLDSATSTPLRPATGADTGTALTAPAAPSRSDIGTRASDHLAKNPKAREWWAHQLDPANHPDPTITTVTVPTCAGMVWTDCQSAMTAAQLVPSRVVLDFEGADLTKPAAAVISTSPPAGATVDIGSAIEVVTNPDAASMPVAVPMPLPYETAEAYRLRLVGEGLLGVAGTELTEATLNPMVGPEGVGSVHPAPGTRVLPNAEVEVRANPASAPRVTEDGTWTGPTDAAAPWSAPSIRAVNLQPLAELEIGCQSFPFGIFCWLNGALGGWGNDAGCPSITVPFTRGDLVFDFCQFEPAMDIVRPIIAIVALLCLAYFFAASAMGLSPQGNED